MQGAFDRISQSIIKSIDSESFVQLCELLPNLCKLFPLSMDHVQKRKMQNDTMDDPLASVTQTSARVASPGGVGSGSNRLNYLFHIIFKAVCNGGHPVANSRRLSMVRCLYNGYPWRLHSNCWVQFCFFRTRRNAPGRPALGGEFKRPQS